MVLWANDDLKELAKVGITQQHIDELVLRIDICRKVQTSWIHYKETQSELDKNWKKELQNAKDLYRELLCCFTFAFRNEGQLLKKIKRNINVNKQVDLIQTLIFLAQIGNKHKDLLAKVSFDFQLLDKAFDLSIRLRSLSSKYHINEKKSFRDKSYTYLKQCLDEIREAGKFVFRNNKKRLCGYKIAYYLKKNAEHRANKEVTA